MSQAEYVAEIEKAAEAVGGMPNLDGARKDVEEQGYQHTRFFNLDDFALVQVTEDNGISAASALTCSKVVSIGEAGEIITPYFTNGIASKEKFLKWAEKHFGRELKEPFTILVPDTLSVVAFRLDLNGFRRITLNGFIEKGQFYLVRKGYVLPQGTKVKRCKRDGTRRLVP